MKKEFGTSKELKRRYTMVVTLALIVGIFLIIFGVFRIFGSSDHSTGSLAIFIGMLQLLWAWLTADIVKTTRLILTPEKLEFHSPGLALTTSWGNLERIGRVATYDSLVLRASATQKTAWWFKLLRQRPEREIPMSMFSNWRVSEIGQEIKQYAPHLFSGSIASK